MIRAVASMGQGQLSTPPRFQCCHPDGFCSDHGLAMGQMPLKTTIIPVSLTSHIIYFILFYLFIDKLARTAYSAFEALPKKSFEWSLLSDETKDEYVKVDRPERVAMYLFHSIRAR